MEKLKHWFNVNNTTTTTTNTTVTATKIPGKTCQAFNNENCKTLLTLKALKMKNKFKLNKNEIPEKNNEQQQCNNNKKNTKKIPLTKSKMQQEPSTKECPAPSSSNSVSVSVSSVSSSLASSKCNDEKVNNINGKWKSRLNAYKRLMLTRRKVLATAAKTTTKTKNVNCRNVKEMQKMANMKNVTSSKNLKKLKITKIETTIPTATTAAPTITMSTGPTFSNNSNSKIAENNSSQIEFDAKSKYPSNDNDNDNLMEHIKRYNNNNNNSNNNCNNYGLTKIMKTLLKSRYFQNKSSRRQYFQCNNNFYKLNDKNWCCKGDCNWQWHRSKRTKLINDYCVASPQIRPTDPPPSSKLNSFKQFIMKWFCCCPYCYCYNDYECNYKRNKSSSKYQRRPSNIDDEIEVKIAEYLKEVKAKHYVEMNSLTAATTINAQEIEMYNLKATSTTATATGMTTTTTPTTPTTPTAPTPTMPKTFTTNTLLDRSNDIDNDCIHLSQQSSSSSTATTMTTTVTVTSIPITTITTTTSIIRNEKLSVGDFNNSNARRPQHHYSPYLRKDGVATQSTENVTRLWTWDDSLRSNSDRFLETLDEETALNTTFKSKIYTPSNCSKEHNEAFFMNINSNINTHNKMRPSLHHIKDLLLSNHIPYGRANYYDNYAPLVKGIS